MKGSVIVGVIVGAVLGFVVGRATNSAIPVPTLPTAAATTAAAGRGSDSAKPPAPARSAAPMPSPFRKVEIAAFNPVKGPKDAKVTIVEFSDFQCPFCGRVVPTLKQIEEAYSKDVRVVFRHQPLPFHPYAMPAAEAAMAANDQGKFWEMHDKLFASQGKIDAKNPVPDLERLAQEIGLDMGRFKSAMESHKFKSQVEQDSKYGNAVGANGTPTFFVDGRLLSGAQPFDSFKAIIDDELKKADALLAKGVKRDKLYETIIAEAPPAPAPTAAPAAPVNTERRSIDIGNAPVKGPSNAPVTIVEFSDFQCPFCGRVVPTVRQIEQNYGGKVKVAFKQMPLPFHNMAQKAAEAALAANAQGKFWEMHDKMFGNQRALDQASLEQYAQEIGLDVNRFKADLESGKYKDAIEADKRLGQSLGATGTPTFFVNGRILVGAQPYDQFQTVIDEELSKKVALRGG
jgi:protein-disulfide isomerase